MSRTDSKLQMRNRCRHTSVSTESGTILIHAVLAILLLSLMMSVAIPASISTLMQSKQARTSQDGQQSADGAIQAAISLLERTPGLASTCPLHDAVPHVPAAQLVPPMQINNDEVTVRCYRITAGGGAGVGNGGGGNGGAGSPADVALALHGSVVNSVGIINPSPSPILDALMYTFNSFDGLLGFNLLDFDSFGQCLQARLAGLDFFQALAILASAVEDCGADLGGSIPISGDVRVKRSARMLPEGVGRLLLDGGDYRQESAAPCPPVTGAVRTCGQPLPAGWDSPPPVSPLPPGLAVAPPPSQSSCPTPGTTGALPVVTLYPGRYGNAEQPMLNTLLNCINTIVWFSPGAYSFTFNTSDGGLKMDGRRGTVVVGGTPKDLGGGSNAANLNLALTASQGPGVGAAGPPMICATDQPGVLFAFGWRAYFEHTETGGVLHLCGTRNSADPNDWPIAMYQQRASDTGYIPANRITGGCKVITVEKSTFAFSLGFFDLLILPDPVPIMCLGAVLQSSDSSLVGSSATEVRIDGGIYMPDSPILISAGGDLRSPFVHGRVDAAGLLASKAFTFAGGAIPLVQADHRDLTVILLAEVRDGSELVPVGSSATPVLRQESRVTIGPIGTSQVTWSSCFKPAIDALVAQPNGCEDSL